ncbi:MAG: hypothetical protein CM15mV24_2160 [Bellamyvirus sp.]|nr:MAG: hypothetical protein CM15mV24_2160 [Bellamyvirus sp.]
MKNMLKTKRENVKSPKGRTLRRKLLTLKRIYPKSNHFKGESMDPTNITLDNLTKIFEYTKLASEIDRWDIEQVKNIANVFVNLL